jgi:hypothetical protein
MKWRIEIAEGAIIPRGYGVAYAVIDRRASVYYPVPFNVVACWLRVVWRWLRFPAGTYVGARQLREAELAGWQHGYAAGYERARTDAYRDGYAVGLEDGATNARRELHAEVMALLHANHARPA